MIGVSMVLVPDNLVLHHHHYQHHLVLFLLDVKLAIAIKRTVDLQMAGKSLSSLVGKLQLQDIINPWRIFATVSNDHIFHHNYVLATFT